MLQNVLSDFYVLSSDHSIYAWFFLSDGWKSRDFECQAEMNGIRVLSADRFVIGDHRPPNCVRLALTGPPDLLTYKRGLDVLASVLKKEGGVINHIW